MNKVDDRIGDRASFLREGEKRTAEYYAMLAERGVTFDWSGCTARCEQLRVPLCPKCQGRNAEAAHLKRAIDDEIDAKRREAMHQYE